MNNETTKLFSHQMSLPLGPSQCWLPDHIHLMARADWLVWRHGRPMGCADVARRETRAGLRVVCSGKVRDS